MARRSGPGNPIAGMTGDPAGQLQFQQHRENDRRRGACVGESIRRPRPAPGPALPRPRADAVGLGSPGAVRRRAGSDGLPARGSPAPRIGRSTAITSSAVSVSVAPSRISRLVPLARGSSGEPGTAKISRPCSSAKLRGDQRAGAFRRLDHDHAARQAGDDAGCGAGSGAPAATGPTASRRRSTPCARMRS